jgi:RimJ/RimL family protein N-acetyltransferase
MRTFTHLQQDQERDFLKDRARCSFNMTASRSNRTAQTGGCSPEIERTFSMELIRNLATDPAIFPWISDDYTRDPHKWHPALVDHVLYLVAKDEYGYFGFGIFQPHTHSCYEAHIGFVPSSYGAKALTAFRKMLAWVWTHSTAARIVGEIAVENRRAIAFVKRAGFAAYGINPKSKLVGGILRDQECLGISRP